ncbi:MAG: class I SAM-dependent RNA methyltransferase [Flavipsychrobacter sp.]|nr:class I SAM-dependent RNA methyltransferase [Flavipsychrobacter sp.]
MSLYITKAPVTITCHKRLAPYLEQEVRELGFEIEEAFVTGVRINATMNDCMKLNLNLRCASQVLYSLKQFEANNADDVYANLAKYQWEKILPADGYFSVTSNVMNDTINNSMFANLRVKDAIVDRMREQTGKRPETGAELKGAVIHLFWKNNQAEVFADTTGDSLARHGYRKIPGRAPMLEALAAATVMATRWDRKSPFINPMCGSGTVAIEAALIATNTRPGLFRTNYAFMHLIGFDENIYLDERGRLENQITDVAGLKIIATDYSDVAITNAIRNAVAAGVADMIDFSVCDFADTPVPEGGKGVMFVNPEYGERLGEATALEATYTRIGDFMKKKCGGYYGYVFTGNPDLAKKIGLKAKRRIEFYTSIIDCRMLEFELYDGSRRMVRTEESEG